MSTPQQLIKIRSRKLGLLIYDARTTSRRSSEDCAQAMCVPVGQFESYEKGLEAPSLPELEALAFYLDIPLEHFWGNSSLIEKANNSPRQSDRLIKLRNRIVSTYFRLGRTKANSSFKELSDKTGLPENQLKAYELGEAPIPLPELEIIAAAINMRVEDFFDQNGPIGKWSSDQQAVQKFMQLTPEIQQFVCTPVNRPYLELAIRLSELSVERLRAIAEGLLEITY
jgi:transcriptional regulator with XRE-family HTH domain